jgi:hypothetical protein
LRRPLAQRASGIALDRCHVPQGGASHGGDLTGEPVDLAQRLAGAPPQRSRDLLQTAPRGPAAIMEVGAPGCPGRLDPLHQPAQLAYPCSSRLASVGWSMSASITVVSMRILRHCSSLSSNSLPSRVAFSSSTVCAPLQRTSLISVVGCCPGWPAGCGRTGAGSTSPRPHGTGSRNGHTLTDLQHHKIIRLCNRPGLVTQLVSVLEIQQAQQVFTAAPAVRLTPPATGR